jgi:hypothetical protein
MQPSCLQATMNAENASLSRTRGTQALDPGASDSWGHYPNGWNKPVQTAASAASSGLVILRLPFSLG